MPASMTANQAEAACWPARGAAGWLAVAASPSFALMAWITASGAPRTAFCTIDTGILPAGGMTAMYALMSLFHLPPWLKLASGLPPWLKLASGRRRAPR